MCEPSPCPADPHASAQFKKELTKANSMASKYVDGNAERLSRFGEVYAELPDNLAQLDAMIDVLAEELANTIDNPQVVQKHEKVSRFFLCACVCMCFFVLCEWAVWGSTGVPTLANCLLSVPPLPRNVLPSNTSGSRMPLVGVV